MSEFTPAQLTEIKQTARAAAAQLVGIAWDADGDRPLAEKHAQDRLDALVAGQ